MGMFDHLIPGGEGAASPQADAPARGGMFDHLIPGAQAQAAPARSGFWHGAADVARSIESGADRGIAGLAGFIGDIGQLAPRGADNAEAYLSGRSYEDVKASRDAKALIKPESFAPYGSDAFMQQSQQQYDPETRLGKFAKSAAEFGSQAAVMPIGAMRGGAAAFGKGVAAYGVVPGVASEAAGQATEGSSLEPYARVAAGLGGVVAGGRMLAPRSVEQALAERTGNLSAAERAEALRRLDEITGAAQSRDIPLSNANAFDFATQGRSDMSGMQRHVEAMGGMRDFYARQPAAVDAAARPEFDRIAPIDFNPDAVGPQIGAAARTAVEQSPQGRALTQAQRDAGPRVTPLQAGEVIQPDQRRIFDERYQARSDASGPLYRAAEEAPERVGVDRMLPVERFGEPIVTPQVYSRPQFEPGAPAPLEGPGKGVAAPERAGPESLSRFIAKNGGIAADGDMLANDFHRFNVPGAGTVAREGGKPLDSFWRPKLMEAGYLPMDAGGGTARDIRAELFRKLRNEQVGVQTFPAGSEREMAAALTERNRTGQLRDEFDNGLDLAKSRYHEDLTNVGIDPASVHPDIQSRVLGATMRDPNLHPLDAHEAVVREMRPNPEPLVKTTTQAEEMYAPRFGQVNPQSVIDHIDNQLHDARGPVRDALIDARKSLFDPRTGESDLSIAGLNGARKAINAAVEDAPREVQASLLDVRNRLDAALSVAPEYERARATHEAFSRPLDTFAKDRPLGQVVGQDQKSGQFLAPPERVPAIIDQGPSAGRDLVETRSMASRTAYEGHLRTRLLDSAVDMHGQQTGASIRQAILKNQDQLNNFPDVRRQLESIATAREGRMAVEQSPVGRLARNDLKTKEAVEALFPANPLPNSEQEIERTVGQLAAANPWAARQLVRIHAEGIFNEATQKNMPGVNQMGGAKFAAVLAGNPQQATNLATAVRALPSGNVIADGFGQFLDVMEAMGKRQAVGSRTAYNAEDLKGLSAGKKAEVLAKVASGNVLAVSKKIGDVMERWRLGKNMDEMARLFSDPNAVPAFRGLLNQSARGGDIRGPVSRLVAIASSSARDTAPLRLSVQPNGQAQ